MPRKATAPVLRLEAQGPRDQPATGYRPADSASTYLLRALKFGDPVTAGQYERLRQAALNRGIVLSVTHP